MSAPLQSAMFIPDRWLILLLPESSKIKKKTFTIRTKCMFGLFLSSIWSKNKLHQQFLLCKFTVKPRSLFDPHQLLKAIKNMYFLPLNIAIIFINIRDTVIVRIRSLQIPNVIGQN